MRLMLSLLACSLFTACAGTSLDRRVDEAEALVGVGDQAAALEMYESVAKECPSYRRCAEVYLNIADMKRNLVALPKDVSAAYGVVIEHYPLTEVARIALEHRADFYERINDYLGAAEDYASLLQYYPSADKAPRYLLKLGEAYLAMGNRTQARIELEGLVREVEYDPEIRQAALFDYAESFFLDGRLGLAEKWYTALVEEYPDSTLAPEAYMKIATCQEERGFLGDATQTLQRAKRAYPNVKVIDDRLRALYQRGRSRPLEGAADSRKMREMTNAESVSHVKP